MASEDVMMMDDDTSSSFSSTSTECSSSSSSSSLLEYSSSSTNSAKPTISTTTSNKRKLMLVIEGYNFQLKNFNQDRTVKFWRCANRTCRVLIHTTLENEFLRYGRNLSLHSHLPKPPASEVRNLREAMRKRAENETTSLQKIAEQEVRQALLTAEALAILPRMNHLGMVLLFPCTSINSYICCLCLFQVIIWCIIDVKQLLQYHNHRPFSYRKLTPMIIVIKIDFCYTIVMIQNFN